MFYLLCGTTLISFSAVLVKLTSIGPTMTGFYCMLVGGMVLALWGTVHRQFHFRQTSVLWVALLAGLFLALDLVFWHRSIHYVGPGLATILINFQVVFLTLFVMVALREPLTWTRGISIPVSLMGLLLLCGVDWHTFDVSYRTGIVFGLLAAILYAVHLLLLRTSQTCAGALSPAANMALVSLATAGLLGPIGWVQGESFVIQGRWDYGIVLAYGVLSQVVAWPLIAKGLLQLEASRAGLILLLQPALAFVWGLLFFHRSTSAGELIGVVLAMGAIYLGSLSRSPSTLASDTH